MVRNVYNTGAPESYRGDSGEFHASGSFSDVTFARNRRTDRQTDRQTDRRTDGQTDRQTEIQ